MFSVALKAQQLPHWPWSLTAVTTLRFVRQSKFGGIACGATSATRRSRLDVGFGLVPRKVALNSSAE